MPPAASELRCPRCQFAYAWDGEFCDHCHHPYPSRTHWNNFHELARFAAAYPDAKDNDLLRIAIGCIRRAWHLLTDPDYRSLVVVAERFVEGRANYADLAIAADPIVDHPIVCSSSMTPTEAAAARAHEAIQSAVTLMSLPFGGRLSDAVFAVARHIREALALEHVPRTSPEIRPFTAQELRQFRRDHPQEYQAYASRSARIGDETQRRLAAARVEEAVQCDLYRDVVGYPFGPTRPAPLELRTDVVVPLADSIYLERAFDRLPVLADALEDAGCTDAEILDHCRADRSHIRGCWVVELYRSGKSLVNRSDD